MAGQDKAAVVYAIAITAIFIGIAASMSTVQDAGPAIIPPMIEKESMMEDKMMEDKMRPLKAGYERAISDIDPGLGHESHQLAVLLAPSDKVYSGTLVYDASENIQLITLRGPIGADETPAMTWTPDGETIFELTLVDPKNAKGEWVFSGNALAVHTMKTTPFQVDYKILDLTEEEANTVELEEMAMEAGPASHIVEIPAGTSVPGCETSNECYSPADITINAGDTIEWINVDSAVHTVTAGTPSDAQMGVFNSDLIIPGNIWENTFVVVGSNDYFCMVHPWMVGSVTVN